MKMEQSSLGCLGSEAISKAYVYGSTWPITCEEQLTNINIVMGERGKMSHFDFFICQIDRLWPLTMHNA